MELLRDFGTAQQKKRWLEPLLDGRTRSAFAMTEPAVASSDATNIAARVDRSSKEGGGYVVNARKYWCSNGRRQALGQVCALPDALRTAGHPHLDFFLVVGRTGTSDADEQRHRQHSIVIVPRNTQGVTLVRPLTVFGYVGRDGRGACGASEPVT